MDKLQALNEQIIACERCPRLIEYCRGVAKTKRRMYMDWDYWGKPLAGLGDPRARLLVVGLAPAAHGGNRTGRMFTGDSSADWLLRAMHRAGFANQPTSDHKDDGLRLTGAYITAIVRCAPPDNRPTTDERNACLPYVQGELDLLPDVRAIVALGHFAFAGLWQLAKEHGATGGMPKFGHGVVHELAPALPPVVCSYHPSRQNTNTGRLTEEMFDDVFSIARQLIQGNIADTAHV